MHRTIITLSICAALTATGCGSILGELSGGSKSKRAGSTEIHAAREKKDVQALTDICTLKREPSTSQDRTEACNFAMDLMIEKNDVAAITEICDNHDKGEKYHGWRNAGRSCDFIRNQAGDASLADLRKAGCDEIIGAFGEARDHIGSGALTDQRSVEGDFVSTGSKMAKCGHWDFLIEEMAHWGQDKKGLGYALIAALASNGVDWRAQFLAYVERKSSGELFTGKQGQFFLRHYTDYLVDRGQVGGCEAYVPVADRVPDASFGPLNWYFRKSGCKAAADVIARRLSSDQHETREGACTSLGLLGTSAKHLSKVKLLAGNDPYYWLKKEDDKGRALIPPVKVYDVRDACAAAANKLTLR